MTPRDEIYAAMNRLLAGQSQHTDGRLTKTNLALEAGIGRATLYRQHDLLDEWTRRVVESDGMDLPSSTASTIARLTRQLADERDRRRESDRVAQGLAVVVAELYRQLESDSRHDSAGRIIPLKPQSVARRRSARTVD
ncbi:hypothetical protein [Mycolicibacterium llatzerense]|uniref:hypothetical protein n=1 Tax=Mycolicibacterium llatzerense TaxID=280871 RepID=UPI0021B5D1F3|nr:hypothetical protein [Mycolicibacterium llatzerense]MCT7362872.1 hypothetical protein [Mycolicibacterium llatzerense]